MSDVPKELDFLSDLEFLSLSTFDGSEGERLWTISIHLEGRTLRQLNEDYKKKVQILKTRLEQNKNKLFLLALSEK